jgi:hypothetical protein
MSAITKHCDQTLSASGVSAVTGWIGSLFKRDLNEAAAALLDKDHVLQILCD